MRRAAALLLASACVGGNGTAEPPPPASELIREGAERSIVQRGDLDGDGTPELVVASVSSSPNSFGLPTPYLEIFAEGNDGWQRVFDASGNAPAGDGTPSEMLFSADDEFAVGQAIEVLELVDMAGDGSSELVAAVANIGATAGPLELWIVSMNAAGDLTAEYYMSTERGGKVGVSGDRVAIEFGVYRKRDPGCCPSSFEVRSIGFDPETGAIGVLEKERTPLEAP